MVSIWTTPGDVEVHGQLETDRRRAVEAQAVGRRPVHAEPDVELLGLAAQQLLQEPVALAEVDHDRSRVEAEVEVHPRLAEVQARRPSSACAFAICRRLLVGPPISDERVGGLRRDADGGRDVVDVGDVRVHEQLRPGRPKLGPHRAFVLDVAGDGQGHAIGEGHVGADVAAEAREDGEALSVILGAADGLPGDRHDDQIELAGGQRAPALPMPRPDRQNQRALGAGERLRPRPSTGRVPAQVVRSPRGRSPAPAPRAPGAACRAGSRKCPSRRPPRGAARGW